MLSDAFLLSAAFLLCVGRLPCTGAHKSSVVGFKSSPSCPGLVDSLPSPRPPFPASPRQTPEYSCLFRVLLDAQSDTTSGPRSGSRRIVLGPEIGVRALSDAQKFSSPRLKEVHWRPLNKIRHSSAASGVASALSALHQSPSALSVDLPKVMGIRTWFKLRAKDRKEKKLAIMGSIGAWFSNKTRFPGECFQGVPVLNGVKQRRCSNFNPNHQS
ncbi:hypothetical protein C8R46DRAFT_1042196 [Mycena filopes]|nr:hypothetical protein C8R46DRAFT_1042196 [Mycena filopes]